ncbi:MAG: efflux transporter outer membrane subunit [Janthinobacterium lividum]
MFVPFRFCARLGVRLRFPLHFRLRFPLRVLPPAPPLPRVRLGAGLALALACAACTVGPDYHRPTVAMPANFKEAATLDGWRTLHPDAQAALKDKWWTLYNDPELNTLCEAALVANQNIATYAAAYRSARALVAYDRASLFPTVSLGATATRSNYGSSSLSDSTTTTTTSSTTSYSSKRVGLEPEATWEPDLWGKVRRSVESGRASAQSSDAELAGERLSILGTLAVDYFTVRQADADLAVLADERLVDAELLTLSEAQFKEGVATYDDVRSAHNTLQTLDETIATAKITRRQYEHAIAVLIGQPPAAFSLPARTDYAFALPALPKTLPSSLLERRPDVVEAERNMAAYNAKIGVAKAGYYPTLSLTAEGGWSGTALASLISLPTRFWSLGLSASQTLFDGGATSASVRQAEANYDQYVATYRQAVLTALQDVEDDMTAVSVNGEQTAASQGVVQRSQELYDSEQRQFDQGTVTRIAVLDTRLTALADRKIWLDYQGATLQNSVLLIKALGGGWNGDVTLVDETGKR